MKKYAGLLIIMAGTCWGAIGIFIRKLNAIGIESMQIVEIRAIVAMLLIGIGVLIYDKRLFKIRQKHIWCFLGTGIVGIIFFNLCYFITIEASSLSVAAVLLYTAPIFVMIFSAVLFQEKITRIKVISLTMAFTGCVLVSGIFDGSAVLTAKGFLIGICAGLGYALYTIFSIYALNYGYNPLTVQFYTFLFAVIAGAFFTDFRQVEIAVVTEGTGAMAVIAGIGLICTAVPNVLYTSGLRYIDNGKTSVMASIEPVMAIVFGILLFHEVPTPLAAAGMLLSLSAIILVNYEKKGA